MVSTGGIGGCQYRLASPNPTTTRCNRISRHGRKTMVFLLTPLDCSKTFPFLICFSFFFPFLFVLFSACTLCPVLILIVVLFILGRSSKVFVGYSIYKGKAALTVTPKAPEFSLLDVASLSLGFSISFFFTVFFIFLHYFCLSDIFDFFCYRVVCIRFQRRDLYFSSLLLDLVTVSLTGLGSRFLFINLYIFFKQKKISLSE
jgi:hypothetical protein